MENLDPTIILGTTDQRALLSLLDLHDSPAMEELASEIHRAVVVDQGAVPADVVAMNADVVYEDCDTLARREVKLVYPKDASAERGHISVLAPIGSALLGLRVGQTISWQVPSGTKRIRVVAVRGQRLV